jgi:bifunctional non-homologous end joining protein LigD
VAFAYLRCLPLEQRKTKLARLVRAPHPGLVLNQHYDSDGAMVFRDACRLGCEGIVSKRLGSLYRFGRSPHWLKVKKARRALRVRLT